MQYRRSLAKGATFFFTVVTHNRRTILCHESNVISMREAFQNFIMQHPFTIDAFVLLPEHLHCIWTLPENDNDFSMRWRQIKSYFSRRCGDEFKGRQTTVHLKRGEQAGKSGRNPFHVLNLANIEHKGYATVFQSYLRR